MKGVRIAGLGVGLLALVLGVGTPPIRAQSPATLRVGAAPLDSNGPLYYAQDLGYFKEAGISVEFASGLNNAAAALAALSAGALDLSAGAVTSIAAAHDANLDLKIVAGSQMSEAGAPSQTLVVLKDSSVRTAADLNGKTIGIIGIRSFMQVAAMSWSERHGGDAKALKFVEIPVPQMCAQLEAGRIDAAILVEPFLTGCRSARAVGNVEDGVAARFITIGFAARDEWLNAHRDVAARFATAIVKAAAWGNTHQRESAAILVKYAHLDPATAANAQRARYATELTPSLIQPVIDASARYGAIPREFPASDILWTR